MLFNQMCKSVDPILSKIHNLPFNIELAQGTLPNEKFIFYLTQDALYLADFSRALALTAARLPNNFHAQQFIEFALGAIKAERELHFKYIQQNYVLTAQSPACFMYTNYLIKLASTASVEEAVASLLPCFWIYHKVGKRIAEQTHTNNPYHAWIELYASQEFELSVQAAIDITSELAHNTSDANQNNMLKAFMRSTQLEWLFWDSAYRQEAWQV